MLLSIKVLLYKMDENIKEAFLKVKDDINELNGEVKKIIDRVNDLAVEVKERKKKKT